VPLRKELLRGAPSLIARRGGGEKKQIVIKPSGGDLPIERRDHASAINRALRHLDSENSSSVFSYCDVTAAPLALSATFMPCHDTSHGRSK